MLMIVSCRGRSLRSCTSITLVSDGRLPPPGFPPVSASAPPTGTPAEEDVLGSVSMPTPSLLSTSGAAIFLLLLSLTPGVLPIPLAIPPLTGLPTAKEGGVDPLPMFIPMLLMLLPLLVPLSPTLPLLLLGNWCWPLWCNRSWAFGSASLFHSWLRKLEQRYADVDKEGKRRTINLV